MRQVVLFTFLIVPFFFTFNSNGEERYDSKLFHLELTNEFYQADLNEDSLLNKQNILDLPEKDDEIHFRGSVSGKLFSENSNYYSQVRGRRSRNNQFKSRHREEDYQTNSYFKVDQLYIDYEVFPFYLVLGKERVSWGNGILWNPADVINPRKQVRYPEHDEEGRTLLKFEGDHDVVNYVLYYTAGSEEEYETEESGKPNVAAKFSLYLDAIDLSAYYHQNHVGGESYPIGILSVNGFVNTLDLYLYVDIIREQRSYYRYFDEEGNVKEKSDTSFVSSLVGLSFNRQFVKFKLSLIVEYFRNAKGYSEKERTNYFKEIERQFELYQSNPESSSLFTLLDYYEYNQLNREYFGVSIQLTEIFQDYNFLLYINNCPEDHSSLLRTVVYAYPVTSLKTEIFHERSLQGENDYSEYGNFLFSSKSGISLTLLF